MALRALPSFHVARPRLVRLLTAAPVALVEAGRGYGKSVLVIELREHLGVASAEAVLEQSSAERGAVVGALRRGLQRARRSC